MSIKPSYLLQTREEHRFLDDVTDDELLDHYGYYLRLSRAAWLKKKYGELPIPKDLFATVVDADVIPPVLDYWFELGGLNAVYYFSKVIFNGGEDADCTRIREVQEDIRGSQ